eukprot:1392859-Amorphochlora_amoeboformis.AAC.3
MYQTDRATLTRWEGGRDLRGEGKKKIKGVFGTSRKEKLCFRDEERKSERKKEREGDIDRQAENRLSDNRRERER